MNAIYEQFVYNPIGGHTANCICLKHSVKFAWLFMAREMQREFGAMKVSNLYTTTKIL